jgi:CAP12/Pycsar effector protein, TIR domain
MSRTSRSEGEYARVLIRGPDGQRHRVEIDLSPGADAVVQALAEKLGIPSAPGGASAAYKLVLDDVGPADPSGYVPLRFELVANPKDVPHSTSHPTIYIGHGHSGDWRLLKDHLRDIHRYNILTWESELRVGQLVPQVIMGMLHQSDFALLVHTSEDETSDNRMRARQNVVYETGLFHGRLGIQRALIVRQRNCESFSNVRGVHELRFDAGHIESVFGDILGVLRREFNNV